MTRPFARFVALLLAACLTLPACAPRKAPDAGGPRLVLIVVVDQLAAEYLVRFGPLFEGGLHRLLAEGVSFTDAHHVHALTATAPGHATLATGVRPRRHGIIGNSWWDREEGQWHEAVDDEEDDHSPRRLLAPTLGDWAKTQDRRSKVFTAAGKDRAAIFLGGRHADGAFWYDTETGGFKTSSYYGKEAPPWLEEFNDRRLMDAYFGTTWEPLPVDPELLARLEIEPPALGPLAETFPHPFGSLRLAPDESFYYDLFDSPWLDLQTLRFAEHVIRAEGLGGDGDLDVLAVGLSALDIVGHDYGPNSREVLDILLRLDRHLGDFLDFVDREVGLDRVVLGLSADHGVPPLPEFQQRHGRPGRRVGAPEILCLQRVEGQLRASFGEEEWLLPGPFLNAEAIEAHGLERQAVERRAASLLAECPSVARVWTRSDLAEDRSVDDPYLQLFINGFNPERSPDFEIQYDAYFVPYAHMATTHGSPYRYDTWVPMVVRAPGLAPAEVAAPVRTLDFAPTLAALAGVAVPEGVEGVALLRPAPGD